MNRWGRRALRSAPARGKLYQVLLVIHKDVRDYGTFGRPRARPGHAQCAQWYKFRPTRRLREPHAARPACPATSRGRRAAAAAA
jgi:hypothetical protein